MARISLQPAFILHARPFRDTSLLLDLFTSQHGRISAIARGARSSKSKIRGLLLPFVPLLISWSGKTELMTITQVDSSGALYDLSGNNLLSGLYLNELLTKLLHRHDPYPNVYNEYQNLLIHLNNAADIQPPLRIFEKNLLAAIGYGLQLDKDNDGNAIDAAKYYQYQHGAGFVPVGANNHSPTFNGQDLLAFTNDNLSNPATLKAAKRLMRLVFSHLLDKPLKSRELFN